MSDTPISLFSDLNLSEPLIRALKDVGYETPSPIQAATIPLLLANRDVLGQAQTGTGKTAAFALPILSRIDLKQSSPQALVLAPTRELAIQVAEAFQVYAAHIPGFHVLPIYGGQSYGPQLSALRRGVHVVVGTPGRVIDHLDKGSLDLSKLKTLVLDEADEMLRMGFIDDVERILQETPEGHQTALFSATMPSVIKRIATTYLVNPAEVTVAAKTGTADNIRQRYWLVSGMHKLDALTRILEAEAFDGMIIFARTKLGTEELAGKLQARGFSAAAINGDIQQAQRERTIQQLKDGKIDILVATDVAARGLDVERISHVVNYDVPHDPESYTHRIGRTGRAGRSGEAILFITPREKNLLKAIERSTRQPIGMLELPTIQAVNDVRIAKFKEQISETLALGELEQFQSLIEDFEREQNIPAIEIAAALAKMARGNVPLLLDKNKAREQATWQDDRPVRQDRFERNDRPERGDRFDRNERSDRGERPAFPKKERIQRPADAGMQTFRIEVGHQHGVKPGNIVGAIANEAGIDSKNIGRIEIYDDYSVLDLPDSMPKELLDQLKIVWVAGQQLRISRDGDAPDLAPPAAPRKPFAAKSAPAFKDAPADAGEVAPRAPKKERPRPGVTAYRIEVGREHAVTPSNIVGAIANEANLEAKHIGRIDIFDNYSVLDLPEGMPPEILDHLKSVVVSGQKLRISLDDGTTERKPAPPRPKSPPRKTYK
ncbi:DEAD/DEAH box helicase [Janthinobacterium sp. PLB04]|uniref:ATP-dependent RNA helicase DeaD n=1 Tax=Janthinobacterium lividum TaxID=29581 RepID=A0AAJ4MU07_9BURK|nr:MULTISPECIES: DEAD/DEAH box helicase [Janthinobacterium]KAB0330942.1 DEAD/DEAH box helicase [Janthinobacterium lividum]QSX97155.1 DEAD/DEAH box helicase [Janthinobacterium lividum]UGQ37074.1 DEAD/DEAH box helicase [Janthinobacterium sp. PLB04]